MSFRAYLQIVLIALFVAGSATGPIEAAPVVQDQGSSTSDQAEKEVPSGDQSPAGLTDSRRLMRIERVIEADKERLSKLQADLEERENLFEEMAAEREGLKSARAEKTAQVEELKAAGDLNEASSLEAELAKLEQQFQLLTNQTELTYNSAKSLQDQIRALQQKIEKDEKARDQLTGVRPPEDAAAPGPTAEVGTQKPTAESSATSPLPQFLPGAPAPTGTPSAQPPSALPETAEQIEARREAERREAEAQQADQAVMDFLERKAALEEQIELEQDQLQTAGASRENLDQALREAAAELEEGIAGGADQAELAEIQRRIGEINKLIRQTRQEIDERRAELDSLHERLDALHEEQLAVTQEAEARRQEAAAARKRSIWLESPLHPQNIYQWIITRGPRMLLVIAVAVFLLFLIRLSARGVARSVVRGGRGGHTASTTNRADTLALSFRSAASLLIVIAGTLLVFQEAGVDIKTVLGGAAILGVGIAFGAQNLMRDYFNGFMILLEDQYELGDLITIGNITGRVEKVNMRTTVLRDLEGRVHFIPNGEVKSVTNRTYVWGRAVLEVPIGYKEDVDRVMEVILDVAKNFRADPEFESWVTDDPVMLGVDKFTEYGVVIKFMMQTRPDKIFPVRRQMLRRIKNRFDREGIDISVPHRVIIQGKSEESS
ncbi:MAG: mechanosensitive ion channel domain-containing protein [Thermoanaerobaculia bacterium]